MMDMLPVIQCTRITQLYSHVEWVVMHGIKRYN